MSQRWRTFCDALFAALNGHVNLLFHLLDTRAFFGPLRSLPTLFIGRSPHPRSLSLAMHILNSLMLFPLVTSCHNTCAIMLISLVGSLINHARSVITLIRLTIEKELLHNFTLVVASHV